MQSRTLAGWIVGIVSVVPPVGAATGGRHGSVPEKLVPEATWVFYLHGAIVESEDRRAEHPRFGVYEYDAVADALAAEGFEIVSEARPAGTTVSGYAEKVAGQVRELLARGVPGSRIALVGHSKGGVIALEASSRLARDDITYVILAACGPWMKEAGLHLRGRLLSLYDRADDMAGSCREAVGEGFPGEETRLELGGGHGVFFRPLPEWVEPAAKWIRGEATE